MPSATTLAAFCAATLVILVVPGPSVAYVVARSLRYGRAAGLYSMVGLEIGALVHVALAAVGLATVVASSPAALEVIRWAGAAYLVILGVRQLVERPRRTPPADRTERSADRPEALPAMTRRRLVGEGVLVDLLNPKTALFFLAFLPQFIRPHAGATAVQTLVLGLCFVALAALCDGVYALAAGGLAGRLRGSRRADDVVRRTTGGTYLGLAGLAALA